jgi:2,5-diketo-D-gluconate reductase A
MTTVPNLTLGGGIAIPQLGFGVYKVPPADTGKAVLSALEAGYRSIDTAKLYGNERELGEVLRESGVPREDVFVTTKLWNDDHGHDSALRAFDRSLAQLGLDHVDLYLIHWPQPGRDEYVPTWRALTELREQGRVRAVGVSNFQPAHLRRLIDETGVTPSINQVELHPLLPQRELRAFHAEHGIVTEAWAPLARTAVFDHPVVTGLAARYDRTPAQVLLRWHVELGNVAIPKSVTPSRIRENLDVFDFALTEDDLAEIATLENGTRTGPDPDTMG